MIASKKIISIWKWSIILIIVFLVLAFATAPEPGVDSDFIHLIFSLALVANAIFLIVIPLLASVAMKRSFIVAFFTILIFNIVGSVILFFIYRRNNTGQ